MMKFSPEFNDKVRKFRKNKLALWSLRILVVLFLLTLPAELLMNDKPIAMRIDGNWFFPVFKSYTYKDLGGTVRAPVYGPRHQLLAGTVLAGDQHIGLGGRDLVDDLPDLPDQRRVADKVLVRLIKVGTELLLA